MPLVLPHSIFYHIPKTGGTWVRAAIRAAGIPANEVCGSVPQNNRPGSAYFHATPSDIRPQGRFSFAFVRHPLAYYQSYWAYKTRKGPEDFNAFDRIFMREDFSSFVRAVLGKRRGWVSGVYRRFAGPYGKRVSFIGKQERLADDLIRALTLAGEEFDEAAIRSTPPQNVSASDDLFREQCRYSRDLAEEVLEAEHEAVILYGYSACGPAFRF